MCCRLLFKCHCWNFHEISILILLKKQSFNTNHHRDINHSKKIEDTFVYINKINLTSWSETCCCLGVQINQRHTENRTCEYTTINCSNEPLNSEVKNSKTSEHARTNSIPYIASNKNKAKFKTTKQHKS